MFSTNVFIVLTFQVMFLNMKYIRCIGLNGVKKEDEYEQRI